MATDDGPSSSTAAETRVPSKSIGSFKAGAFLGGVTLISVFAGFGLALARVKKKNPKEFSEVQASKLALKALGLGTLLSVSSTGLLILAVKRIMNVNNIEEFSAAMQRKMPQKDGEFVKKFESWKLPRKSTNDEKEWEKAIS